MVVYQLSRSSINQSSWLSINQSIEQSSKTVNQSIVVVVVYQSSKAVNQSIDQLSWSSSIICRRRRQSINRRGCCLSIVKVAVYQSINGCGRQSINQSIVLVVVVYQSSRSSHDGRCCQSTVVFKFCRSEIFAMTINW